MFHGVRRTLRYVRSWKTGADVRAHQVEFERDGSPTPATLLLPPDGEGTRSAWIALGGVTRMGRFHPQLDRFARALASTGTAVVVPEIPEWQRLRVSPRVTEPTIRGCVRLLDSLPDTRAAKYGLIGFSFGAPQVAIASSCDDLVGRVAGIVLFGGYCSLERTLICQLTGDHDFGGAEYVLNPGPYGRWVVASNHLTDVPGHEDARDVAEALRRLAFSASDERISAWDPFHDTMIEDLREALPERRRALFDLFATVSDAEPPDVEERLELAKELAAACRHTEPRLEPEADLAGTGIPTRLIQGRGDRLIPFTESERLQDRLPPATESHLCVTGLFNHSADSTPESPLERAREQLKFFVALRGVILSA